MNNVTDITTYLANKQLEKDMDSSAQEGFDIFRVLKNVQDDYREGNGLPIMDNGEAE